MNLIRRISTCIVLLLPFTQAAQALDNHIRYELTIPPAAGVFKQGTSSYTASVGSTFIVDDQTNTEYVVRFKSVASGSTVTAGEKYLVAKSDLPGTSVDVAGAPFAGTLFLPFKVRVGSNLKDDATATLSTNTSFGGALGYGLSLGPGFFISAVGYAGISIVPLPNLSTPAPDDTKGQTGLTCAIGIIGRTLGTHVGIVVGVDAIPDYRPPGDDWYFSEWFCIGVGINLKAGEQ